MLVGVIAVCLAIVANNARRQKRAVEKIQALGGLIGYDFQHVDESSRIAAWLRSRIGVDFVSHVFSVQLPGSAAVNDDILATIAGLRRLEMLRLNYNPVGDDGLAALKGLTKLLWLELNETNVTDAGLVNLRGMSELQALYLTDNRTVTDAGLVNLRGLTELRALWLNGNGIGDDGLVHLSALRKLQTLGMRDTLVTDAGLAELLAIPELKSLDLSGSKITRKAADEARAAHPGIVILGP